MTKKKVMLADVLWTAANERLAERESAHSVWLGKFRESCCAVLEVVRPGWIDYDFWDFADHPALVFLRELGCDPNTSFFEDEYRGIHDDGIAQQSARYMWLILAMHVAADERIRIEVET